MREKIVLNNLERQLCTGCSACVSVCPKHCLRLMPDAYRFYFPGLIQEAECIDCGLCADVCPALQKMASAERDTEAYAAFSMSEDLRRESSSGGIFSELARDVLKDHGVVYGAAYDRDFHVVHRSAEMETELAAFRGAKYAQSDPGECFSEIRERLRNGQRVLFSGTPCQVGGLKTFLGREYETLLTVDFVCHGISAPGAWEHYVHYRSDQDSGGILPKAINLRSKKSGWSRYRYSNLYSYPGGRVYAAQSGSDLFMRLFVGDYINRESCAQCAFKGYDRVSDITLGDFWGIWEIAPEMDDDRGTSLILVHSEKGRTAFRAMEGRIRYQEVTPEEASRQNPSMLKSSPAKPQREEVLKACMAGDFGKAQTYLPEPKKQQNESLMQRMKRKIKAMCRH